MLRIPICGMGWHRKFQYIFVFGKALAQGFPVLFAGLDELRQTLQLHPADRGLGIERFEVVAQVAVGVFMVVTLRQFT